MNLCKELGNLTSLFYFFDDILIVDKKSIIEYAETLYPELYGTNYNDIVGKCVYEQEETVVNRGILDEVLRSGNPVWDFLEKWSTAGGIETRCITSIIPIVKGTETMGALKVTRFFGKNIRNKKIDLCQALETVYSTLTPIRKKYFTPEDIITEDPTMLTIKQKIIDVASSDCAVLICGEAGTGKKLAANVIHSLGIRRNQPFISQNCSILPEVLEEVILFGIEKNGSVEVRKGLFELAQGGTLLLEEVNSTNRSLQEKLLEAIEEKKIRRVGGETMIPIDVRIISTLNENPVEPINQTLPRSDLLYHLSPVAINLPPLKDRKGDAELLADYYIKFYDNPLDMKVRGLSKKAIEIFRTYEWPGNVRELKRTIESAFQTKPEHWIGPEHLPGYINSAPLIQSGERLGSLLTGASFQQLMDDYEKRILSEACRITKTKTEAAKVLKMSKQTLNYRLGKFGLD